MKRAVLIGAAVLVLGAGGVLLSTAPKDAVAGPDCAQALGTATAQGTGNPQTTFQGVVLTVGNTAVGVLDLGTLGGRDAIQVSVQPSAAATPCAMVVGTVYRVGDRHVRVDAIHPPTLWESLTKGGSKSVQVTVFGG